MENRIISVLFNKLPNELLNDPFFANLKNIFINNIEGLRIWQLSVCEDYFHDINELNTSSVLSFTKTFVNKSLFYITLSLGNKIVSFRIIKDNDLFDVKLVINNGDKLISINLFRDNEGSRIETVNQEIVNNVIKDYKFDVYYYDKNYRLLDDDTEKTKDKYFSVEFGIPLEDARFYRNNFKLFSEFLNEQRENKNLEFADEFFVDDKYKFMIPFYLDEFELFMTKEMHREACLLDESLLEYEVTEARAFNKNKLATVLEPLKSQIGLDGEIVISKNIFDFIEFYLLGFYNSINTTGFIIKKVSEEYILYFVKIENSKLIAIPKYITHEDLKIIYNKNLENANVPGLDEFFGFNRSR